VARIEIGGYTFQFAAPTGTSDSNDDAFASGLTHNHSIAVVSERFSPIASAWPAVIDTGSLLTAALHDAVRMK
jgi:hypothetical protein